MITNQGYNFRGSRSVFVLLLTFPQCKRLRLLQEMERTAYAFGAVQVEFVGLGKLRTVKPEADIYDFEV